MAEETTTPSRTLRGLGRVSGAWAPLSASAIGLSLVLSAGGHPGPAGLVGGLPLGVGLGLGGLGRRDLVLPEERLDAGDVPAELAQAAVVVELAGDVLEPQVEQLLAGLEELGDQLVVAHLSELGDA